ncbi:MAG TPA: ABC transporter permease subunit [Trueperaceae bacterium]
MLDRRPAHWLGLFATLFLVLFFGYPLATILWRSAGQGALLDIASNPYYWGRFGFTLGQALLSTALTLLLGLPAALLFGRYSFRGKKLLRSAFTVPFVMPTVVAAVGFLALVGPRGLLGLDLRGTLAIILLAHVFYNFPVVVRIVGTYLEAAAPRLREAASVLGAGAWRTTLRVELPLALPALAAAASLVFIFTFTSFGVILILAPNLPTVEVEIYRLTSRLLRLDAAAVLVLAQLLLVALVSRFYVLVQRRLAVRLSGSGRPLPRPEGLTRPLLALQLLVSALLLLAPLLTLAAQAVWPPGHDRPSLAGFRALLEAPLTVTFTGAGEAVGNSLMFAVGTTFLSLLVGFAFAFAVVRGGWRWLDEASLLPLATSAVSLGFGFLIAFPQLATSAWGLLLAHTLVAFPFVARALLPALRALPAAWSEAAATLGAGAWSRLRKLDLPLLRPALSSAAAFAFAVSMGEFGATLVITRPEFATIPVAIYDRLGRPGASSYSAALSLSLLLMLVTAASMLILDRSGQGEL